MDIRGLLDTAGINVSYEKRGELVARCPNPAHDDHKPSWSINQNTLAHFCFSCGYKGTLRTLLIDITGAAPDDLDKELAVTGFLRRMEDVRHNATEVVEEVVPILTDWVLANILDRVPQRMLDFRHLVRTAVDTYEVRWEDRRWVLPMRDTSGALLGAQYRQKGSVVTLPEGMQKSLTFFGWQQCVEGRFVAVTESPLDAIRLYQIGVPAVSSLGAYVSPEQCKLLARNFTRVYLALDNDKAGRTACDIVEPMLKRMGTCPIRWNYAGLTDEDGTPAKDPGDVATDDMLHDSWERTVTMGFS